MHYQVTDEQQQQEQRQQGQRPAPSANSSSSSWSEAANQLKAKVGAPWSQMLFFSSDPLAIRQANRLGMASMKVPVTTGLTVDSLRSGLDVFNSKIESDRGY